MGFIGFIGFRVSDLGLGFGVQAFRLRFGV